MTVFRPLECRSLTPEWTDALTDFFGVLTSNGDMVRFHPHPFTPDEAEVRTHYAGNDVYCIMVEGREVLAYGMLRGWDEGYTVPSLGIAVHPTRRGLGLGKALMHFLHAAARCRGARQVRLKVYADNLIAIRLYEELGYRFSDREGDQMIGVVDLARA